MIDTLVFAEKEHVLRSGGRLLDVSGDLRSKNELIGWYAATLPLPDYWSSNWDAFTDFMEDLSWLPDQAIDIYHENLPLAENQKDLSIYINILHATVRHWRRFPEHNVRVAFHPRWEAAVSRITVEEP